VCQEGLAVKKIIRSGIVLSVLFAAVFIGHFIYVSRSPEYDENINAQYSLNSRNQTALLALFYTMGRGGLLLAGGAAIYGVLYMMRKRYFFLFAGMLCIIIGIVAMYALFKATPAAEINKYIHIPVISFFVVVLGFVFIYAQFKNRTK